MLDPAHVCIRRPCVYCSVMENREFPTAAPGGNAGSPRVLMFPARGRLPEGVERIAQRMLTLAPEDLVIVGRFVDALR